MAEKPFRGLLEVIGDKKFGFIREMRPDVPKGPSDPFCSPPTIRKYNLRDGVLLEGTLRPGRKGDMQVHQIFSIMDVEPEVWAKTRDFDSGHIVYPDEKFDLVKGPNDITMRVVDLACPIGKGQRALIVAPPRTGKTIILKEMAAAMTQNHPDVELVALLVDERPEEVTDFKQSAKRFLYG